MAKFSAKGEFATFTTVGSIKVLKEQKVRFALIAKMRELGKEVVQLLNQTTTTWERRPKFQVKPLVGQRTGARVGFRIETDSEVWMWLNYGTSIRYATMTSNFRPKTRYRSFQATKGRGGLAVVWPGAVLAPGIEGRLWTQVIEELFRPVIFDEMRIILLDAGAQYTEELRFRSFSVKGASSSFVHGLG